LSRRRMWQSSCARTALISGTERLAAIPSGRRRIGCHIPTSPGSIAEVEDIAGMGSCARGRGVPERTAALIRDQRTDQSETIVAKPAAQSTSRMAATFTCSAAADASEAAAGVKENGWATCSTASTVDGAITRTGGRGCLTCPVAAVSSQNGMRNFTEAQNQSQNRICALLGGNFGSMSDRWPRHRPLGFLPAGGATYSAIYSDSGLAQACS
jgi:hypothetical protein